MSKHSNIRKHQSQIALSLAAAATLACSTSRVLAVTGDTYTGASSTTYSDPGNWALGAEPGSLLDAVFNQATYINQPTVTAPDSVYGLAFGPTSGTLTLGGSVGNSLTVGFDGVKVSSGAGTVLISAPLTLSAANTQIINNSANTLTIATLIGGSNQLTFGGTGTTYLSNTSAGGTGGGGSVSTTGGILLNGGTLHFNVSSSAVTGGVTINGGTASMDYGNFSSGPFVSTQAFTINSGGTLIINAAHALASYAPGATLIVNGGTVVSNDEQYLGSLTLNGGSTIKGTGGDGSYEFRSNGSSNTNITSVASSTASTIGTNLSVVYSNYVFNVGAGSVSTGADLTVNGTIFGTTASYGVYKSGPGNLVLTASNTYAGTTAVNAGTLTLASGASLNAASNVSFGGGTLSIPAAQAQTFAGATVATGGSSINAPTATVNLGSITRTTGSAIDFGTGTVTTTTANSGALGILGGWATTGGGTSFAVGSPDGATSTTITPLAGYTEASAAGTAASGYAGRNIDVDTSTGATDAPIAPNVLRFSTAGSNTLTVLAGTSIASGGVLMSPSVGANSSTIAGGSIMGTPGGELDLNAYDPSGTLTVSSTVVDNGAATALVKAGPGVAVLSGANTFTGSTFVSGGVLSVSADGNLGTAPASATALSLVIDGGTLSASTTFTLGSTRGIAVGGGLGATYGTIDVASGGSLTYGGIIANNVTTTATSTVTATGGLIKTGAGTLVLSGSANAFTGNTVVNGGTLTLTGTGGPGGVLASPQIVVNNGGTLVLNSASGDVIGYTTGRELLVVNDGVVSSINAKPTIQNVISMTGGTLTSSNGAVFELNSTSGVAFNATSDAAGNPATLGSGSFGLNSTQSFNVTRGTAAPASDMTIAGLLYNFGSAAGLIKTGNGILTITNSAETYSGNTTVNAGTLVISGTGSPGGVLVSPQLVVNNGGALVLSSTGSDVLGYTANREALVINSGGLISNIGTRQTIETAITMNGGTLQAPGIASGFELDLSTGSTVFNATSDALGNPATLGLGTFALNHTLVFNVTRGALSPTSDMIVNGTLSTYANSAGLTKAGNGILTLTNTPTYTGATTINAGTLLLTNASGASFGELYNSSGITVNTGGTLALVNNDTLGYTAGKEAVTIAGGTVTVQGTNHMTLASSLTMTGGTLTATATPASYSYSFDNTAALIATSDASGNPAMITAPTAIQVANATFNITRGTASPLSDVIFTKPIVNQNSGTYAMTKTGNGFLTLTGTSTYNGGTTISAGMIRANSASQSLGTGSTTIASTGILAGTGATGGGVILSAGGTITAGSGATSTDSIGSLSAGVGTFTGAGTTSGSGGTYAVKFNGGGTVAGTNQDLLTFTTIDLVADSNDQITLKLLNSNSGSFNSTTPGTYEIAHATTVQVNGTTQTPGNITSLFYLDSTALGVSSSNFSVTEATNPSGGFDIDLTSTVPEPASLVLLGIGSTMLLGRRRRRQQA